MTYEEQTRVTLPDLLDKGFSPRDVRFLLLQTHYRQPVRLTDEALESARASLRRIDECVGKLREVHKQVPCVDEIDSWILQCKEDFRRGLYDDVNIAAALAAVFRLVRQANYLMSQGRLCPKHAGQIMGALEGFDHVLAILPPSERADVPAEVQQRVDDREKARQAGDFDTADRLRDEVAQLGYGLEDRAEGPRVRVKR